MKALAIVAHPDDETIWMGNQILRNKKWKWTIFSLCRASDKDRRPKFLKVCKLYNAQPIITELEDERLLPLNISYIIDLIDKNLKDKEYGIVYTHGENGEYGHIRHKEAHQAVKKMIKEGKLKTKKMLYFNYEVKDNCCIAIKDKNYNKLTDKELVEKKKIITEVYGFDIGSFEEKSCGDESLTQQ